MSFLKKFLECSGHISSRFSTLWFRAPKFRFLTESNRGDELTEFGRLKLKNLSFGGCSVGGCRRKKHKSVREFTALQMLELGMFDGV
ncbi:hypothetical protein P8452_13470 [Trifolium repens]|nr:hypothetical protein P8452_13470 [Trifolium repens]